MAKWTKILRDRPKYRVLDTPLVLTRDGNVFGTECNMRDAKLDIHFASKQRPGTYEVLGRNGKVLFATEIS